MRRGEPKLTATVAASVIMTLAGGGCALRSSSAQPSGTPSTTASAPEPRRNPPEGPLSTPQTRAELPPEQPIPDGAAPPPSPMTTDATPPTATPVEPEPEQRPVVIARPRTPEPAPVEEPPATAPTPTLAPILSATERRAYEREIADNLLAARRQLSTITSRSLSAEQLAAVKRIRAFVVQAEGTREQDLASARNIAQRARVLADDLERSTR